MVKKYKLVGGNADKQQFDDECPGYKYLPTILPAKRRIITFGDIHGDYELALTLLKLAKVIDSDLKWIGGDTHVVQVGDQLDRCRPNSHVCNNKITTSNDEASDIKILKLFTELHNKALPFGGAVISLLGNHELMNVKGQFNYVSYLGLKEFDNYVDPVNPKKKFKSGVEGRKHAFKVGNEYANFMACTRLSSVVIGSNLFVHAGILPEFIKSKNINDKNDLTEINNKVRKWLLDKLEKNSIEDIVGNGKDSIFWNRILGSIPNDKDQNYKDCEKYLEPTLKILQIGHMIIGHTPQFYANNNSINSTCSSKLWRVDIGSSSAFNEFDKSYLEMGEVMNQRKPSVLEILNDNRFNIITANDRKLMDITITDSDSATSSFE